MLRYTMRGLTARTRSVLPTFLAVGVTVAAVLVVLGALDGLTRSVVSSGNPLNEMVLKRGADAEEQSTVTIPQVDQLKVLPGIARVNGVSQISPEFMTAFDFRAPDGGLDSVPVRGADAVALTVHGVALASGAWPERGHDGLVIGEQLLGRFQGFSPGGSVRVSRGTWPVVGVLRAPGTRFESEVWCDRTALMGMVKASSATSVVATLDGPQSRPRFVEQVARILPNPIEAVDEPSFYRRATKQLSLYLEAVLAVVIVLALGAIFACANLMYATFLERSREFATLVAIGFTKRSVAWIVVQEGFFLSIAGGAAGFLLALALNGHPMRAGEIAYQVSITVPVIVAGGAISAGIGVLGSALPALLTRRLDVLAALRS
jgi:hypothetical protein